MDYDCVVLGTGAAGIFCALQVAKRGLKVLCIEKNNEIGKKILISGGGRCNFTNLNTTHEHYGSDTPDFVRSALARFTPWDTLDWYRELGLEWTEKKEGQLFCATGARTFLVALCDAIEAQGIEVMLGEEICFVEKLSNESFQIQTNKAVYNAPKVIVATGGLSFPKLGASGIGYDIAKQFGHSIIQTEPGLVPFVLNEDDIWNPDLSGLSFEAKVSFQKTAFRDSVLLTHQGLSGPAILQISNALRDFDGIEIDSWPNMDWNCGIDEFMRERPKASVMTLLSQFWPKKLAKHVADNLVGDKSCAHVSKKEWERLESMVKNWRPNIKRSAGYNKAEVTRGGVDCRQISSKTMESKQCQGLYFIGEVLDVTGQLGGYNFQWAWASAHACASSI